MCRRNILKHPLRNMGLLFFMLCLSTLLCFGVADKITERYNAIVVIYGHLETFPLTCGSIFENIMKHNSPCKVILNIDGGEVDKKVVAEDPLIQECLQGYVGSIDFIIEGVQKKTALQHGTEFDMMDRALDHIEANNYQARYLIKVRTDNVVNAPIDISAAFGTSSSFTTRFMAFHHQYAKTALVTTPDDSFSMADILWQWVFTAGMPQWILPMVLEPSPSPWCFINATAWNKDVKSYIFEKYNHTVPLIVAKELYSYRIIMRDALADIHSRFDVAYLIGRSYIHFGRYETVARLSRAIVKDYGHLSWNVSTSKQTVLPPDYQWPFTGEILATQGHNYDIFEWREVVASQLRLEHWKQGVHLVDLQNIADDIKSHYNSVGSLFEDTPDPRVIAFLLAPCHSKNRRYECNV